MAASNMRSYMMAAEVAAEIVSQKLEILLSHPVCVECLPMETHAKDAKAKVATVQEFLSTLSRQSNATEWLGRLLRAMYYAEDFIDEFHFRESRQRHKALRVAMRPLAALASKYMLQRHLCNLVKDVHNLFEDKLPRGKDVAQATRKKEPATSSSHASVPWRGKKLARLTNFWDQQASSNFIFHANVIARIMDLIKKRPNYGVQVISICGERGIGKTFLARWVYREAMHLGFGWRAWVQVLPSMDQRDLLFEILKQVEKLPTEVKDLNIYEISEMICQKLTETKSFLIVLDDVHQSDIDLLHGLMRILSFCSGGHVITTTQSYWFMAWTTGLGAEPINLTLLGAAESKRMLAGKLRGLPCVNSLIDGASKILETFNKKKEKENISPRTESLIALSLPLCISLLGGLVSNAKEHERQALLKECSMMTLLNILELSYNRLPVHLKPCFIYMALFPSAFPIPTRRLVRLWLAEGLLDSHCYDIKREKMRPLEEVGETFILELADRNVIDVVSWRKDGSPKACQMLTSLYDFIRLNAMGTRFLHVHNTSESKGGNNCNPSGQQQQLPNAPQERTKVRWLAEHTDLIRDSCRGSYPDLNLRHVRSFLSFYLRRGILTEDISTFLRNMTFKADYSLLRVLDLEGVYKPSLQGVLHKLVLLRYLGLRRTVLGSIPRTVADLHYLETLDIKHTSITSLPSSLWKARNLRHLHLNWFYGDLKKILEACSNNVMALTQLQTLSGLVIGEVKENVMKDHMDSLTTLTTLKLFLLHSGRDASGASGNAVADWISSKLANLQSLTFGVITKAKKEDKPAEEPKPVNEKVEKAESVEEAKPTTSHIGPLPKLSLAENHQELLELYLLGQLNEPIWTHLFPGSLRVLTLSGSRVKADMMVELGGLLRNLRTLRLLANSFLGTCLNFTKDGFPSLKILKIWKLPQLEVVTIHQGAMPYLKELEFRHLNMMKNVEGLHECKELENISVISQSDALVNQLRHQIQEKNLHVEIDTYKPGFKGDDENLRDVKEAMPYVHIEGERRLFVDGDSSGDVLPSDDPNAP